MDGESLACCGPRGRKESGLSDLTTKGKWDIQEKNLVFFCVWVKEERKAEADFILKKKQAPS